MDVSSKTPADGGNLFKGARKLKSGSIRRFKQELAAGGLDVGAVAEKPDINGACGKLSGAEFVDSTDEAAEKGAAAASDVVADPKLPVTKIVKPVRFRSSIIEMCITFKAIRLNTIMLLVERKRTHYQVLSVNEDASYDEIRASYKAAILTSHPDKLHAVKPETSVSCAEHQFLEVRNAWQVLGDSVARAKYDAELRAFKQEHEVLANEVKLEEMTVEMVDDVQELLYECRCGDYFAVNSLELLEMGICLDGGKGVSQKSCSRTAASVVLPCGSCSLKIRLMLDVEC